MKNKNWLIRIITGLCIMAVFLPAIFFGGVYFLIVSVVLSYIGSFELMNMFYKKSETLKWLRFVIPIFCSLIVASMYFTSSSSHEYTIFLQNDNLILIKDMNYSSSLANITVIIFILGVVFSLVSCIFIDKTTSHDIMACITTLVYTGVLFGLAFSVDFIIPIDEFGSSSSTIGRCFGYLYSIVLSTDIFAYFFGMLFGKHRLCVNISPKKSVEGAVAGLVLGGIFGTLFAYVFGVVNVNVFPSVFVFILVFFILSVFISFTVQIGDLIASKLKRTYEIKDYGFIFPGHGGVMDRFDSFIFSGAVFYIVVELVYTILYMVL